MLNGTFGYCWIGSYAIKFRLALIAASLYDVHGVMNETWSEFELKLKYQSKCQCYVDKWMEMNVLFLMYAWGIYIYPTGAQYIRSESLFKTDKMVFIIFYTTSWLHLFLSLFYGMNTFYTCVHACTFLFSQATEFVKTSFFYVGVYVCVWIWMMDVRYIDWHICSRFF